MLKKTNMGKSTKKEKSRRRRVTGTLSPISIKRKRALRKNPQKLLGIILTIIKWIYSVWILIRLLTSFSDES